MFWDAHNFEKLELKIWELLVEMSCARPNIFREINLQQQQKNQISEVAIKTFFYLWLSYWSWNSHKKWWRPAYYSFLLHNKISVNLTKNNILVKLIKRAENYSPTFDLRLISSLPHRSHHGNQTGKPQNHFIWMVRLSSGLHVGLWRDKPKAMKGL